MVGMIVSLVLALLGICRVIMGMEMEMEMARGMSVLVNGATIVFGAALALFNTGMALLLLVAITPLALVKQRTGPAFLLSNSILLSIR